MKQALQSIVRRAGELILNAEEFRVEQKEGHANFVTDVDEQVQRPVQPLLVKNRKMTS